MPILVVDDYNTMIRIIRNLLKQIGFENVDDASGGLAAPAKMQGPGWTRGNLDARPIDRKGKPGDVRPYFYGYRCSYMANVER